VAKPFAEFSKCVAEALGADWRTIYAALQVPPREDFGDIAILSVKAGLDASTIAVGAEKCRYVESARTSGIYVNITLNRAVFADTVARSVSSSGYRFGVEVAARPLRVVVEYVSANPVHPLHVGAGRNAVLGNALYRMLSRAGHIVQRRFYINDVGRQTAVLALGFKLLGEEPPENVKPDHWAGMLYAATNILIEVGNLKKRMLQASEEERREILKKIDELLADLARIRERAPDLVDKLIDEFNSIDDPEREIREIMKKYEQGERETVNLVRRVVSHVIRGFEETLKKLGVEFDVWDWESDLVWGGEVKKILDSLLSSEHVVHHKGVPAVDFSKILTDEVRRTLRIPKTLEVPPLVLLRSDETTLYTVRDIAYTLKKFAEFNADLVVNVIASEQTLPQAQLRLALYTLGFRREAENLVHYSYEMVLVEGERMSSRRGRLVTLDELLHEAKSRILEELKKRGSEESEEVAERVAAAAIKFALLKVTPSRPLKFTWDSVLDFERNTAPYLLYTYARIKGIERKAAELSIPTDMETLIEGTSFAKLTSDPMRWRLVKLIAQYPLAVEQAYRDLDPSFIAFELLKIADAFNTWYERDPVIKEADEELRYGKLLLVELFERVIKGGLDLLGIDVVERL